MGKNEKIKLAVALVLFAAAGFSVYWFVIREDAAATPTPAVTPSPQTPTEKDVQDLKNPPPGGGGSRRVAPTPG